MQKLIELPDEGVGVPVSFFGKSAAHSLNDKHKTAQLVDGFQPFSFDRCV